MNTDNNLCFNITGYHLYILTLMKKDCRRLMSLRLLQDLFQTYVQMKYCKGNIPLQRIHL